MPAVFHPKVQALDEGPTNRDIVLVIDTTVTMAYETQAGGNDFRFDPDTSGAASENPAVCNVSITAPCLPMDGVKNSALSFIDTLNFAYDRVAIISLTGQESSNATKYPSMVLPLTSNKSTVAAAINSLRVFTPRICQDEATSFANILPGSCIQLADHTDPDSAFIALKCHYYEKRTLGGFFPDYPACPTSNIGGALRLAGAALSGVDSRSDASWMVVTVLSGPANATDTPVNFPGGVPAPYTNGYCPENEFYPAPSTDLNNDLVYDYRACTDGLPNVRHSTSDTMSFTYNGATDIISVYDPDDYARDQADALATLLSGNGVKIHTIGLGAEVLATTRQADTSVPMAQALFQYIANCAGDNCGDTIDHGSYFYAPNTGLLDAIFTTISLGAGGFPTPTSTITATPSNTLTATVTGTNTPTSTITRTGTITQTPTNTPTSTSTRTATPSATLTPNIPRLPAPTLLNPVNNSTSSPRRPVFRWAANRAAINYQIQVDNDSDFSSPEYSMFTKRKTQAQFPALENGQQYWWRVQVLDKNGNWSDWSSPSSFQIIPAESTTATKTKTPTRTITPTRTSIPTWTPDNPD